MSDYYMGLDLGQTCEFTAMAVVERPTAGTPEQPVYGLRHLHRAVLGTPLVRIVSAVTALAGGEPLRDNVTLVVDLTAVGSTALDLLYRAAFPGRVVPVILTAGHTIVATDEGAYHVPKNELVTRLQVLLQARRLQVARNLPEAKTFVQELTNFRIKPNLAQQDAFVAWREGLHDDLVFAVALACWLAEHEPVWGPDAIGYQIDPLAIPPEGVFLPDSAGDW
jgi:hypothetical protein